jgi:hypothetical protein
MSSIWLEKNVGELILLSGHITALTSGTNLQYATIPLASFPSIKTQVALTIDNNMIVPNYTEKATIDGVGESYTFVTDATNLYLQFPLATYASLSAAQTALANTPVHYQLSTPQLINLTEQGLTSGELMAFENGTCTLDADTFHVQSATFKVPTNRSAQIDSLLESASLQSKQIESKADKVQEDRIYPTFLNGWTAVSGTEPSYYKDEFGVVNLEGRITGGTTGVAMFSLPSGYRPAKNRFFASNSSTAFARVYVLTTGNVICDVGGTTSISLDGISFRAEA